MLVIGSSCGQMSERVKGKKAGPKLSGTARDSALSEANSKTCAGLAPFRNAPEDASPSLSACIKSMKSGEVLALEPGVYTLLTPLDVDTPTAITTKGKIGAPLCSATDDQDCAVLRAGADMAPESGFVRLTGNGLTVDHVVVDGRRQSRSAAAQEACKKSNQSGMNVVLTCSQCTFQWSVSKNALCGTALLLTGASDDVLVSHSLFIDNGVHDVQHLLSDGLTFLDGSRSEVTDNEMVDNSDVDLITGGCRDCNFSRNHIRHTSGDFVKSSHAGMMIQAFATSTSGNYTGTVFENNEVDCGPGIGCGDAFLIGSESWYAANPVVNGTFRNNNAKFAQAGIVVANDVIGTDIGDNDAGPTTGHMICNTNAGEREYFAFAVAPGSRATFSGARVGRSAYVEASYSGAIPNNKPGCRVLPGGLGTSLGQADCDAGAGKKVGNDSCLPSCGSLAGVGASIVAGICPVGTSNAGDAFDISFGQTCCAKLGVSKGQVDCQAGFGKKVGNDSCLSSCGGLAGPTAKIVNGACPAGSQDVGDAFDIGLGQMCCKQLGVSDCAAGFGRKSGNNSCLASCGTLAGTGATVVQGACPVSMDNAGDAYDIALGQTCCKQKCDLSGYKFLSQFNSCIPSCGRAAADAGRVGARLLPAGQPAVTCSQNGLVYLRAWEETEAGQVCCAQ